MGRYNLVTNGVKGLKKKQHYTGPQNPSKQEMSLPDEKFGQTT